MANLQPWGARVFPQWHHQNFVVLNAEDQEELEAGVAGFIPNADQVPEHSGWSHLARLYATLASV
jgi:hypothetical protein